ncbi:UNVERIFIED_CONTAM: hypothetical protein LK11_69485 [Mumia flava]
MQPLQRFALEKHSGPYEQWPMRTRVIVDGVLHPTLAIPGYELLRQYQTNLGFALITNYDCPFEEAVSITLVTPDLSRAISTGTIGAAYYTFWLDDVEWIDANHFRLTCEDAVGDWLVTLRARHIPVLSPAVFIKRRVAPPTQPAA